MYKRLALFLFIAYFLIGCTKPSPSPAVVIPANGLIVLGVVAGSAVDDVRSIEPLADALAIALREYGITGGRARVAGSVEEMAAWLKSGEVDLYFDSVYPALLVSEQSGARLILRGWQFGRPESQAVIFASRSSGLASLDDVRGKVIAMRAPQSTAGFFLPSVYLVERGLTLTGKSSFFDPVSPSNVGFVFSGNDQETLRAVISGSAAAGVVDDYHFDIVFPPETTQQLLELARTEKIPRQVVLARPGLDEQYLAAITQTLTRLHESEIGKSALASFLTTQFETFPGGADAATRRMREMLAIVKKISLP
ncbi:MAG: hypothetical protein Fur0016_11900 [Anaerolineales bacterium]